MAIKTEEKNKINERDYYNRLVTMKENVNAVLIPGANYVSLMAVCFPKYAGKSGKYLLRRVFNGQKQDVNVLADFEALPDKIKSLRG